jgi:hypothetical protein
MRLTPKSLRKVLPSDVRAGYLYGMKNTLITLAEDTKVGTPLFNKRAQTGLGNPSVPSDVLTINRQIH